MNIQMPLHKKAPTACRYINESAKQRSQSSGPRRLRFFANLKPRKTVDIGVRTERIIIDFFPSSASMMVSKERSCQYPQDVKNIQRHSDGPSKKKSGNGKGPSLSRS